ncbi:MAG: nucleotide sugar dehydrogenase [Candidatus Promineifilaceae bacterium]|nr:nucleotide sugar dehydrogenase [Candidatus Promineifilaceae bacterium]
MSAKEKLISKFQDCEAQIGVVGLGYVGLPLAVAFAETGFQVTGIDVDPAKVHSVNSGHSYVQDISSERLKPLIEAGTLRASTHYPDLAQVDAISICVPTPLRKTKDPDISYIIDAADRIAQLNRRDKLIVLESTTYPGLTEEIVLPRLASDNDFVGEDFFLAFSPERIDPGRSDYTIFNTPKVIGGVTTNCLDVALALYGQMVQQPVPVSSTSTAEMVKLLENTFRAVNIGLVNEIAIMCDKLGLDVWEVITAAQTKPYGFMTFYPGPGLGGHCIPVDPHYLSWKLRSLNYTARFIELAAEVNGFMPEYVVSKITDALNKIRMAINGSKILILGVAYKPGVGDVRESPALDIIYLLQARGANISFHDPYVQNLALDNIVMEAVNLTEAVINAVDCIVIVTHHDDYDWEWIVNCSTLIVDTRNALANNKADHIFRL